MSFYKYTKLEVKSRLPEIIFTIFPLLCGFTISVFPNKYHKGPIDWKGKGRNIEHLATSNFYLNSMNAGICWLWQKCQKQMLGNKKINSLPSLHNWEGDALYLVRFPNCIVYSWVYNTQKTVKNFFDCFHSLHQAMHWYVSIRIGIFRVSSPGSNWKNFFSFTQFEVTAILLPPPNL